ncbi:hypothetical protein F4V43_07890 [Paenibacillus spiritus]|uniref:Uncharacterized protein n=1 Tax=Paenibacillus spiritus TaxID=2496557 RepID=A0A5J5GD64_9BACL|nr:hypothetical protein [Paenibacillus spiritus]KAA9005384.1 hypothetical protein F4V43_07890 [Paenibacillus spiritus]
MDRGAIIGIELFAFRSRPSFSRLAPSPGHGYVVLRLSAHGYTGCGECAVPLNGQALDLIKWGSFLKELRLSTPEEAFALLMTGEREWSPCQRQALQSALSGWVLARSADLLTAVSGGSVRSGASGSKGDRDRPELCALAALIEESESYYSIL